MTAPSVKNIKVLGVLYGDGSMNIYSGKFSPERNLRNAETEAAEANKGVADKDKAKIVEFEGTLTITEVDGPGGAI